jgi:hypothetical protein
LSISTQLIVDKCWNRYSNTLLVSLNNRVSIRVESSGRGALPRSPPPVAIPPLRRPSNILPTGLEKFPHAFEGTHAFEGKMAPTSGEGGARERVISEYCDGVSFPRMVFINPASVTDITPSFGV